MTSQTRHGRRHPGLVAILALAFSMLVVSSAAQAQNESRFTGGPKGVVKSSKGDLLEGIMVQLIAKKNAIRTTVVSVMLPSSAERVKRISAPAGTDGRLKSTVPSSVFIRSSSPVPACTCRSTCTRA